MFEHNLFQIFGPRNGKLLCPLFVLQNGIFNAICDLVLLLFREGIDISVRLDGAIPFQHFNMVVEVHSGSYIALRSTKASYMTMKREPQAKAYVLVLRNLQFSIQGLTQERVPRYTSIGKVQLNKIII